MHRTIALVSSAWSPSPLLRGECAGSGGAKRFLTPLASRDTGRSGLQHARGVNRSFAIEFCEEGSSDTIGSPGAPLEELADRGAACLRRSLALSVAVLGRPACRIRGND